MTTEGEPILTKELLLQRLKIELEACKDKPQYHGLLDIEKRLTQPKITLSLENAKEMIDNILDSQQ